MIYITLAVRYTAISRKEQVPAEQMSCFTCNFFYMPTHKYTITSCLRNKASCLQFTRGKVHSFARPLTKVCLQKHKKFLTGNQDKALSQPKSQAPPTQFLQFLLKKVRKTILE